MVKNIEDYVKVGENVEAKVIAFDPNEKRIGLSMKALNEESVAAPKEEAKEKKTSKKNEETSEETSEEAKPAKKTKKAEAAE